MLQALWYRLAIEVEDFLLLTYTVFGSGGVFVLAGYFLNIGELELSVMANQISHIWKSVSKDCYSLAGGIVCLCCDILVQSYWVWR